MEVAAALRVWSTKRRPEFVEKGDAVRVGDEDRGPAVGEEVPHLLAREPGVERQTDAAAEEDARFSRGRAGPPKAWHPPPR